ncbi:hypothetical protein B0H14DRAFT_963501 [Mycena olivaceomarginata]|nr:hypothetical protein B0H14DRAFT_963501 [Mycena olivaceomarginata]
MCSIHRRLPVHGTFHLVDLLILTLAVSRTISHLPARALVGRTGRPGRATCRISGRPWRVLWRRSGTARLPVYDNSYMHSTPPVSEDSSQTVFETTRNMCSIHRRLPVHGTFHLVGLPLPVLTLAVSRTISHLPARELVGWTGRPGRTACRISGRPRRVLWRRSGAARLPTYDNSYMHSTPPVSGTVRKQSSKQQQETCVIFTASYQFMGHFTL